MLLKFINCFLVLDFSCWKTQSIQSAAWYVQGWPQFVDIATRITWRVCTRHTLSWEIWGVFVLIWEYTSAYHTVRVQVIQLGSRVRYNISMLTGTYNPWWQRRETVKGKWFLMDCHFYFDKVTDIRTRIQLCGENVLSLQCKDKGEGGGLKILLVKIAIHL